MLPKELDIDFQPDKPDQRLIRFIKFLSPSLHFAFQCRLPPQAAHSGPQEHKAFPGYSKFQGFPHCNSKAHVFICRLQRRGVFGNSSRTWDSIFHTGLSRVGVGLAHNASMQWRTGQAKDTEGNLGPRSRRRETIDVQDTTNTFTLLMTRISWINPPTSRFMGFSRNFRIRVLFYSLGSAFWRVPR